jgi:hypothetical protein
MNQEVFIHKNEIPDHLWPDARPRKDRIRFTATNESAEFLAECEKLGYDLSTIINLALLVFRPKCKPDGFTWKGIKSVL